MPRELLYVIFVNLGEGVVHERKPDFGWSGADGQCLSSNVLGLFLKRLSNFSGPKANFKLKTC